MGHQKIGKLGPRLLGEKASGIGTPALEMESLLSTSPVYQELLTTIGGAIVFDNGAKYIPDETTPLTMTDGYNSLDVLFGLGDGEHSVHQSSIQYEGELQPSFVPIGGAPGGNLVCVDGAGSVFLWDHETGEVWRVATSLDKFIEKLEPDESEMGNTDGIIKSESFLDF